MIAAPSTSGASCRRASSSMAAASPTKPRRLSSVDSRSGLTTQPSQQAARVESRSMGSSRAAGREPSPVRPAPSRSCDGPSTASCSPSGPTCAYPRAASRARAFCAHGCTGTTITAPTPPSAAAHPPAVSPTSLAITARRGWASVSSRTAPRSVSATGRGPARQTRRPEETTSATASSRNFRGYVLRRPIRDFPSSGYRSRSGCPPRRVKSTKPAQRALRRGTKRVTGRSAPVRRAGPSAWARRWLSEGCSAGPG